MSDPFPTPWTVAHLAPLSMKFPRPEDWSGLQFPSPGNLPGQGIEPWPPGLQADFFINEPPRKPHEKEWEAKRLSVDEWIRKLWYIYTMEYYSAIKKNSFESVLI